MLATLTHKFSQRTVQDIFDLYNLNPKRLNLDPGFQRKSVWKLKDRRLLVDSILKGYPLPSIFLYRRANERGVPIYDVLDGKQRIESLLWFAGQVRGSRFELKLDGETEVRDWRKLSSQDREKILGFSIQVAEVSGDWEEIVSLFVRINSTGKKLDRAEITRANHLNSDLLKEAQRLARRWSSYLINNRILSATQVDRYKDLELMCELIVSAHNQGVINKKDALDKAMSGNNALKGRNLTSAVAATAYSLARFRILIPRPIETRFYKLSDFYSLVVLLQQLHREKVVLLDPKRNAQARQVLIGLSTGVDKLNQKSKDLEGTQLQPDQQLFRSYLQTVKEGTDALGNRRQRHQILHNLIASIFEKKDEDRLFSEEQRRILWNTSEEQRCPFCLPKQKLSWSNLAIDHVKPHALGGKTALKNGQICCRAHNSKMGMKTKATG